MGRGKKQEIVPPTDMLDNLRASLSVVSDSLKELHVGGLDYACSSYITRHFVPEMQKDLGRCFRELDRDAHDYDLLRSTGITDNLDLWLKNMHHSCLFVAEGHVKSEAGECHFPSDICDCVNEMGKILGACYNSFVKWHNNKELLYCDYPLWKNQENKKKLRAAKKEKAAKDKSDVVYDFSGFGR